MNLDCTLNRADLVAALTRLSGVIPMRTVLPVFQCVRLSRVSTGLRIEATDGDRHAEIPLLLAEEVPEFEPLCVPLTTLLGFVKSYGVEVRLTGVDGGVRLSSGSSKAVLPAIPNQEWPAMRLEESEFVEAGIGPAPSLKVALGAVSYAICSEVAHPALMGVSFGRNGAGFVAVATNRHVVAKERLSEWEGTLEPATIPGHAASALLRFLPDDGTVTILSSGTRLRFVHDTAGTFTTGTLADPFPAAIIEQALAQSFGIRMKVGRTDLLAAIQRARLVLRSDQLTTTAFTVSASGLDIHAEGDLGVVDETVAADVECGGDGLRIGLSGDYVAETLSSLTSDTVSLALDHPNKPALWSDGGSTRAVFPLRLKP